MGSHALAPPLTLHAPSRATVWIAAIVAALALGVAGGAFALTLPPGHPTAPAHFQGQTSAL